MSKVKVTLEVVWPKTGHSVLVNFVQTPQLWMQAGFQTVGLPPVKASDDAPIRLGFADCHTEEDLNAFLAKVTRTATEWVTVEAYRPELNELLKLLDFEPQTPMPIKWTLPDDA